MQNPSSQSADDLAAYWQMLAERLDTQIAQNMAPAMQAYLRDDLAERLPRTQAMHCKADTVFDAASMQPKLDALRERLLAALMGTPQPQDISNVTRVRSPLYHQYITAEYPENNARVLAVLKRQLTGLATAYTDYATRMLEQSFAQVNQQNDYATSHPASTYDLNKAAETALKRTYFCMDRLTPPTDAVVYGLTDHRIALMQMIDFMKDTTEVTLREIIAKAPRKPATSQPTPTTQPAGRAVFTGRAPRTRAQVLADRNSDPNTPER